MTDKQLRQLKRSDLIEILYYMRTELDELRAENEQLKARLDALVGEAIRQKQDREQTVHE
ncbi:MAG: hypothetical protein IJ642_09815 [Oscillospiraceae bacterium]|nr:hypothetical protein [Oscillospiraceae bacterium]